MPLAPTISSQQTTVDASVVAPETPTQAIVLSVHPPLTELADTEEIETLRRALKEERTKVALQRATAEQARRIADCLRLFHETLLDHLAQPNFTLDLEGRIVRWSGQMTVWANRSASEAMRKPLAEALPEAFAAPILAAAEQARSADSAGQENAPTYQGVLPGLVGYDPALFTVLPLERIPGSLEGLVVLLETI